METVTLMILAALAAGIAAQALPVYDVHAHAIGIIRWINRKRSSLFERDAPHTARQSLLGSEIGAIGDLKSDAKRRKDPPEVVHAGTVITLPGEPEPMKLKTAIEWLTKLQQDEETPVAVRETINAYPWDAARALSLAIKQKFGFAQAKAIETFFGSKPPQTISVQVDFGVTESIVWGEFELPGIPGRIGCMAQPQPNGQLGFLLYANVAKKHAAIVKELAQLTRDLLQTESIYRGKAVRFAWDSEEGSAKVPEFVDLSRVRPEELVFTSEIHEQIDTTVFAPLRRRDWCKALGIPFKRGICLLGAYGVGKTLAIYVAMSEAKQHGITAVVVEDPHHLPEAMQFARQYAPAVVIAEDIDRVTKQRDETCNDIMDALDGVEAKDTDVMVIFTSNHADDIHEAMRRPGRIDTFIKVTAPDEIAVDRLLRLYGRGLIADSEELGSVCRVLAGQIPAVIREVVERAKLAAVARATAIDDARQLTAGDLMIAARRLMMQLELFTPRVVTSEAEEVRAAVAKMGSVMLATVPATRGNGAVSVRH